MKRDTKLKLVSLSRLSPLQLRTFKTPSHVIRKLRARDFSRMTPDTRKKALYVYNKIQYNRLRKSGLNKEESKRFKNTLPSEVNQKIIKMNKYTEYITRANKVQEERKTTFKKALSVVRKNMGKKNILFDDIDIYIKERKRAKSLKSWKEYKAYRKKHFIPYNEYLQMKMIEQITREKWERLEKREINRRKKQRQLRNQKKRK